MRVIAGLDPATPINKARRRPLSPRRTP